MTRQLSLRKLRFLLPPKPSRRSWRKTGWVVDEFHPKGIEADTTPRPGATYTRATWPPRGRGRSESLTSPRRIEAKLKAARVIELRFQGHTWKQIAREVGYADKSGAWRAAQRAFERVDFDRERKAYCDRYA